MKIAQISATFPPYAGGTGNVCYNNSKELASLGHEVTVFTGIGPNKDACKDGIKIIKLNPLFIIGNAPFTPGLVNIDNFDIVHLHYPFIFGSEFILLNNFLKNKNIVITHHQELLMKGLINKITKKYLTVVGKLLIKNTKKIITPSFDHIYNIENKNILIELNKRKDDVVEIPNGVNVDKFNLKICKKRLIKKYNISEFKTVLFVGALDKSHEFKGVDILLKAFSKINHKKTKLIIIGKGNLLEYYKNLSRKLKIEDKVIFTGYVSEEELPEYYSLCDVFVLPSISSGEIFGLVLIEAMACGKPVIASNLPGVRKVVDNNVNGFLVEPYDIDGLVSKIDIFLHNSNLCEKFGLKGREKVINNYSWKNIGEKIEDTYNNILNEAK